MPASARLQPRPYLLPVHDPKEPQHVYLVDQLGLVPDRIRRFGGWVSGLRLSRREFDWLRLCDGKRTLPEVHAESARASRGDLPPLPALLRLTDRLEQATVLDGPAYRKVADNPVRAPSCIGCYKGEPDALRRQLHGLFVGPGRPGLPGRPRPNPRLRAALLPHIDYLRGGPTFAWGFKEVFEQTTASLFVIIGTSHKGADPRSLGYRRSRSPRYTLTRKDFQTPLGILPTDQRYLDRLVHHYGEGLFDDELICHLPEWSIELEVVFLQYLYEGVRPIRIVPLVVGGFQDCIDGFQAPLDACRDPTSREDIRRMVEALRRVEAETPEPICYLISGDLAHIGPHFGDPWGSLTASFLQESKAQDEILLRQTEAADAGGFFKVIAEEKDRRRICGLSPAYTTLQAVRPGRGKVLHYDQYVDPEGELSVSFASVAFYQ